MTLSTTNKTLRKIIVSMTIVATALVVYPSPSFAGTHKFFISCADHHKTYFKVKYGDIDPGKEWARVTAGKKFAPFHGNACSVQDYAEQCPDCEWEEFEAGTLTGDELTRLTNGDITVIPEVVIGVPLRAGEEILKGLKKIF